MKTFTVYQPYSFAIVAGLKCYETRPRRTNIRGRIAVHAGKRVAWQTRNSENRTMLGIEKILLEIQQTGNLPVRFEYGAVLGTVEIVDCVPVNEIMDTLTERERLLGDYSPGRFAWVLQNPIMFETPIPARGKQGWWEWDSSGIDVND